MLATAAYLQDAAFFGIPAILTAVLFVVADQTITGHMSALFRVLCHTTSLLSDEIKFSRTLANARTGQFGGQVPACIPTQGATRMRTPQIARVSPVKPPRSESKRLSVTNCRSRVAVVLLGPVNKQTTSNRTITAPRNDFLRHNTSLKANRLELG